MTQDTNRTAGLTTPTSGEPTTLSPTQAPGHYGPGYGENVQHQGDDAALPGGSSPAGARRTTLDAGSDGSSGGGAAGPGHVAGSTQGVGGSTPSGGSASPGTAGGTGVGSAVGGTTVVGTTPGANVLDNPAGGRSGSPGANAPDGNTGNMDPDDVHARPPTRNDAPSTPGSDDVSLTFERS